MSTRIRNSIFNLSEGGLGGSSWTAQPFTFVWLTDVHIGDASWGVGEAAALVTQINTLNPDFVLSSGDQILSNGDQTETDAYNAIMANLIKPIYNLRGNHDANQFTQHFVIDHKGIRIIAFYASYHALDPPPVYHNSGEVSSEELTWIETQLQTAGGKRCILVCHYPLSAYIWGSIINPYGYDELVALCNTYGVKLYLSGHSHTGLYRYQIGTGTKNIDGPAVVDQGKFMICNVSEDRIVINSYNEVSPFAKLIPEITVLNVGELVIPMDVTLTSTGDGTRVSTLKMESTEEVTVTLDGAARFYTDAAGTLGESLTWTIIPGLLRTIYLKCVTGTAIATFSDITTVTKWGDVDNAGWVSGANAASITAVLSSMVNLISLKITGTSNFSGPLPTGLTYLSFNGNLIAWTYNGALPTGLTQLNLYGALIAWTYNGALPAKLTYLNLSYAPIVWTYNGALPVGLTSLNFAGATATIAWTYNGALPAKLTSLNLSNASIAWTGLDVSGTGNITVFTLSNYRIAKMSSADMITLLTSLTNRVGALPSTVTINDYADYASPPQAVTDAVTALKAAKSITTVTLDV